MKKIIALLKKVSILVLTSVMILGTLMTNPAGSARALYDDAGTLVGHGYDALSTKNGLNPADKGVVTRTLPASDTRYVDDWHSQLQLSDQNGDIFDPANGTVTLYPGETLHFKYEIQYFGISTAGNGVTISELSAPDFLQFFRNLFDEPRNINVTSTNPNNNAELRFIQTRNYYTGDFYAENIEKNDKIIIEFDLQTKLNMKDYITPYPRSVNFDTKLYAQYPFDRTSFVAALSWTQSATPIPVSKRVAGTTNKNGDETPTNPIVDLSGDEVEYEIELNNNTKGSQFAQIVRDSLFENLPPLASDIKLTSIERIHQTQNPLVNYVELSMDKGTPITTNSVATQDQLDAVTAKLKAGTFVIDEIQEGDKVLIKYKVTVPRAQDSDADGITDQQELLYAANGMDPSNACSLSTTQLVPNPDEDSSDPSDDMIYNCATVDGMLDSDGDGRINAEETLNGYDLFNSDENGNAILDGLETFKTGLNNDFIYDKNGSKKSTSTPYSGYPSVKKTSKTASGDKLIEPGERVDYTIELANFTSGTAYDIPVRDSLYETLSSGSQYGFSLVPGYTVVDQHGNVLTTSGNLADGTLKVEKLLAGEKVFLLFSIQASNNIEDLIGNGASRLTNVVTIDGTTPTKSDNPNGKYSPTDAKASDKIAVGKVSLHKVDETSKVALAGAEFAILDKNDVDVKHITTDANGDAETLLAYGDYKLVEVKAPAGYKLDSTPQPFTVDLTNETITKTIDNVKIPLGKIEITKQDKADGTKLAGAMFEVRDGAGVLADTLITDPTGKATSVDLPLGNYTLVETVAPAGYELDPTAIPMTLITNGVTVTKTIDNTKTPVVPQVGKIEITKQDKADSTKLAGAEFDVKDTSGAVVDHVVTGTTGIVTTKELPLGTYTLVETVAPTGYELDPTAIPVTLTTNGVTVTKTIDNTKTPVVPQVGKIEITKQDKADSTKLAGAEFDVKDATGNVVDHVVTGTTGIVTTKELPLGTYTLVETKAPTGYTLDATPIPVTIVTNGVTVTKTIDNTKTPVAPQVGKIEITKQDKADSTKLAGAEFDVKDATGNVVDHVVTGTTGIVTTKELPLGTYTLVETKAPTGYTLDATPIPVTIVTNGVTVTKTIDNTKTPVAPQVGKIEITKQDKATGAKLAGAEFDVKDASGAVVDHVVTSSTGVVTTKELPLGAYTLVETKSPTGYTLDATPISVTISTTNQVVKQTITNKAISSETIYFKGFEIVKQDKASGAYLAGAEFDVKDAKGNVVDHIKTDANGKAKTKSLPLGNYTLVETKAPSGYMLDATPILVTGKTKDETVLVTVTNEKIVGTIKVSKFDKKTGNRLSGMTFTIRNVQTGETRLIAMNEYNVMNVTNLPLGTYEIKEITAPTGYEVDLTTYTIEVTADKYNHALDIYDIAKSNTPNPPVKPEKPGTTDFTKKPTAPTIPKTETETQLLPDTGNSNQNILEISLLSVILLLSGIYSIMMKRRNR